MAEDEPLTCIERGRDQAVGERGWRAYLTNDEDEPAETVVYCPDCAAREFGAPPGAEDVGVRRAASSCKTLSAR